MAVRCAKCKAENPDTQKFCGECGTKLETSKDVSVTQTLESPKLSKMAKAPLSSEKVAGKYQILEELGRGGMGVVYKAKDTRLERTVALKFLPEELTKDEESLQRFILEAKAAAALNHPQICTIYEIDEADKRTFIAMEYIEGQSLKDKLKSGPLRIEETKHIAIQVAGGLREAHEKGITHRDIKPANIMLTEKGVAKIMDFGLAKLSWGADLTKPSMIMGTAAYMSPEQARGGPVDYRTDIWSFGAMLYEMLTARLPFGKRQGESAIYAILNERPKPLSALRPDISRGMENFILKTLEKEPDRRFQNMEEVLKELKTPLSSTVFAPHPKKSIIVLPFENISPEPEQEYFCDGITEEIITDLSHIHDLLVISRNSSMTFKGSKKKTIDIAREANVRYVLEGSVRKVGNSLRITAQLIDAETDTHLWAEKYTGTLDDIFDIQEKVSRSIADSLRLELGSAEKRSIAERPIANVQAYEFYLKARQEIYSFSEEGLDRALRYLENGLEIVGENVLLFACMGIAYFQFWNLGVRIDESYLNKAKDCAERIFKMEPHSPHGRLIRGLVQCFVDPLQAIRQYKSVLEDDPYNDEALLWLCICYVHLGKGDEANPFIERLFKVDFLNSIVKVIPGLKLYYKGEFQRAREALEKLYQTDRENPLFLWQYGRMLASCGLIDKAVSVFEASASKSRLGLAKMSRLFAFALQNRIEDLLRSIDSPVQRWARGDWMVSFWLAECLALVGDCSKALAWLESAVNLGFVNYPFLNTHDPFLVNIRSDPRFKVLMERVKNEWASFEV
jgi:serine/threonine protein kinase